MREKQNEWTQPLRNEGYIIEYDFTEGMYSALIYFPWARKEAFHYHQTDLNDFYKNMYNSFINKK
jgi:hypothetical protein